jgi:hypothetical protein
MIDLLKRLVGIPTATRQYRIKRRIGGYEPQMSYSAGIANGFFWFPLNRDGYWLEPEAFSHGNPTKRITMSKHDAKRSILRAKVVNDDAGIRAVPSDHSFDDTVKK